MGAMRWGICAAAAALVVRPAAAQSVTPAGAAAIVHQGNARGVAPCVSCHGPELMGLAAMASPRLAGQDSAYVAAQLDAFASGTRPNPVMLPVASSLSPAERAALAAYVSRLSATGALPAPMAGIAPADAATLRRGEWLATHGDWSRTVPACDRCHGPGGVGVGAAMPPLAGQTSSYLSNQLQAWKEGSRAPGPLSLMSAIAKRLSDADVAAVSAYYAAQPVVPVVAGRSRP